MNGIGLATLVSSAVVILVVLVTCLLLVRVRKRVPPVAWWKQLMLALVGYLIVFCLGGFLIAPTGPGSDRTLYILVLAFSCCLLALGRRHLKVIGLVVALAAVFGVIWSTKERAEFEQRMQEKAQPQGIEESKLRPVSPENSVRGE